MPDPRPRDFEEAREIARRCGFEVSPQETGLYEWIARALAARFEEGVKAGLQVANFVVILGWQEPDGAENDGESAPTKTTAWCWGQSRARECISAAISALDPSRVAAREGGEGPRG